MKFGGEKKAATAKLCEICEYAKYTSGADWNRLKSIGSIFAGLWLIRILRQYGEEASTSVNWSSTLCSAIFGSCWDSCYEFGLMHA